MDIHLPVSFRSDKRSSLFRTDNQQIYFHNTPHDSHTKDSTVLSSRNRWQWLPEFTKLAYPCESFHVEFLSFKDVLRDRRIDVLYLFGVRMRNRNHSLPILCTPNRDRVITFKLGNSIWVRSLEIIFSSNLNLRQFVGRRWGWILIAFKVISSSKLLVLSFD